MSAENLTIQARLTVLRNQWMLLDARAKNPRTDARLATEAMIDRDLLTVQIADLEEKIQRAKR